ncbi:MAG: contractile injection system tape measure protein, partial [Candidatus Competibacter sp.]
GWLERGLQDRTPSWLQEWPPLLREEFAAQLWELGKRPEVGPAARHETLSPALADATLAKQWQEALEQARYSDADAIYLGNAGLVILWPFLKTFFGRLGLLEDNGFIDQTARQRGAALLQCIASEDVEPPEYLLPLNKVLCGMALESVFELDTPLSEEEVAECNALLEAVIAQAPILNDMSIQGFRGSFLLRAGVLEVRDGAWLLRVERETYDLVLDRFPWSFEWVKLPWMEAPLRVEW